MEATINIIGAGLAGSEAALQLANRGINVRLFEMRPYLNTPVHQTSLCAELVCSNSFKSTKAASAAGMLKHELSQLDSFVLRCAYQNEVAAGGALAVDREHFSQDVTDLIESHPQIELIREEIVDIPTDADAVLLASGPLTSDALTQAISKITGSRSLSFFDAAAPIVMADSLNLNTLFRQSRYEEESGGDYLNAPFTKDQYEAFIEKLCAADRVILKEFENKELFQACQPIEEIARKGLDAPRYGTMKPVGLTDPNTGHRPWAAVQLRAENTAQSSYNLVGFQTNLTFTEQARVFRMIPGLENADFVRYGVMHRNTFVDAPRILNHQLKLKTFSSFPIYIAGQLCGTEGYCEAIMSGLWAALSIYASLTGQTMPLYPKSTAFGSLLDYAVSDATLNYQPMHVNFGLLPPFEKRIRNKKERYEAYASRGAQDFDRFIQALDDEELLLGNKEQAK